jgi:hypothetical protein
VVRMNPAGSFLPGVMNFAITPAMKPIMMVQMIPTELSHLDDRDPAGVFEAVSQKCGQFGLRREPSLRRVLVYGIR